MGNLDSKRDWGYAPEYVEVMHLLLQQEEPGDYVIDTGESHSIRVFLDESFGYADLDRHKYVEIDPRYFRPTEVDYLLADPTKFKEKIGWEPKVKFHKLVRILADADLELLGQNYPGAGKRIISEKNSMVDTVGNNKALRWNESKHCLINNQTIWMDL